MKESLPAGGADGSGRPISSDGQVPEGEVPQGPLSLLWPNHAEGDRCGQPVTLDHDCIRDLGLVELITAVWPDAADRRAIDQVMLQLCTDPQVIRYRQDIIADLLSDPDLSTDLAGLLPAMKGLARRNFRAGRERSTLQEVVWRLGELESFVECIGSLQAVLGKTGPRLRSQGLQALWQAVVRTAEDETFQNLVRELPDLLSQARTTTSVTIGVNLDQFLQPVEATLLSINDRKFKGSSWLGRLFGDADGQWEGIAPLHVVPEQAAGSGAGGSWLTPMMVPLFRDLSQILDKAAQPIARALRRYSELNSTLLDSLSRELPFYLGAVRLISRVRERGLPMRRPDLADADDGLCEVQDGYNIALALRLGAVDESRHLRAAVVTNEIAFGPERRVIVLTGPNQGGKTTYIQAIGLSQVLAQAGLYVPGTRASISPVDGIFTHFATEEKPEQGTGRFGDEARRLHDIFARVTRHSIVLLNESLSSTSAGESLYLGRDILRVLRLLGARAIYSTHLHELATGLDELNASEPRDGRIVSMVASPIVDETAAAARSEWAVVRSYKMVFGPPLGRSYAREIAERYGVSYEQLRNLLAERGLLAPDEEAR